MPRREPKKDRMIATRIPELDYQVLNGIVDKHRIIQSTLIRAALEVLIQAEGEGKLVIESKVKVKVGDREVSL